jgi:hypothetical protein
MLLAAVVAMVLAAAVPALAQTVTQGGTGNINVACVQNAVQNNVVSQGNGNAQANQYGDNIIANSNINAQAIAQECNINVAQVNEVVNKHLDFNKAGEVVVVKKHVATATAKASAPVVKKHVAADVQYKAAADVQYKVAADVQYEAADVQYEAAAVQYQYAAPAAEAELPPTGGSSLIALGAGVLLVAGGLLARRIVR